MHQTHTKNTAAKKRKQKQKQTLQNTAKGVIKIVRQNAEWDLP